RRGDELPERFDAVAVHRVAEAGAEHEPGQVVPPGQVPRRLAAPGRVRFEELPEPPAEAGRPLAARRLQRGFEQLREVGGGGRRFWRAGGVNPRLRLVAED